MSSSGSYSSSSPPRSPANSRSSRIPIDSLLNPAGSSDYPTRYTSTGTQNYQYQEPQHSYQHSQHQHYSPRLQNYTQQPHYLPSYQQHQYQPPQFHPVQYNHSGPFPTQLPPDSTGRRAGSASSSPGPHSRRERFPSVSSSSSTVQERRRPPRPKYEEEEMYFIWYHRVDLKQEWRQVRESFNAQFPNRQRSGFQGIQCKYYRFIKEKKCPTLRDQKQIENQRRSKGGSQVNPDDDHPAFGVVKWTGVWFPWMKEPKPEKPTNE
ncbi:hypothetical protein VTO42DRAFT_2132 [Malbranchea cinnamomea]